MPDDPRSPPIVRLDFDLPSVHLLQSRVGRPQSKPSTFRPTSGKRTDHDVRQIEANRPWSVFGNGPWTEQERAFGHVSLFSGCGGFDLGFRRAGFRTLWANDNDPDACTTFRRNLGAIAEGDIRGLLPAHMPVQPDVLTAGFPCQPFSNAGSRRGTDDSRGDLYTYAIAAVRQFRPKVVLFENVRGIMSFKSGDLLLIERICRNLHDLGYNCQFKLLDASDHRVPQKRLRVFIAGVVRDGHLGSFHFPKAQSKDGLSLGATVLDIPPEMANQGELM